MKSFEEIMSLYAEPMVKGIAQFEINLGKEPDIEDNHRKQGLLNLIKSWREEFEEFRDGRFDEGPEDIIPTADVDPSCGGGIATEDPTEELKEDGIDMDEWGKDEGFDFEDTSGDEPPEPAND